MQIRIIPFDSAAVPGKLADAEILFTDGLLAGMKLIGFGIWERRGGGRNVTFPARQYAVNGERRSYALLRPIVDSTAQTKIRDLVLEAYQEYEERAAIMDTYDISSTKQRETLLRDGEIRRQED